MEQDTDPTIKKSKSRSPSDYLVLNHSFELDGRRVTFRPDASCHIQIPRPSGSGHKSLLAYLEIDRSTEGHQQWTRKLHGIDAFFADQDSWKQHWPHVDGPTVVLFVLCKSKTRIVGTDTQNGLTETSKNAGAASRIRFTTYPLDHQTVFTGDVWLTCEGQTKRIVAG